MHYSQRVYPDPPAAILELDSVVQQHAEQRVDHVGDLVLLGRPGMDVRQGYQPLLWEMLGKILISRLMNQAISTNLNFRILF